MRDSLNDDAAFYKFRGNLWLFEWDLILSNYRVLKEIIIFFCIKKIVNEKEQLCNKSSTFIKIHISLRI